MSPNDSPILATIGPSTSPRSSSSPSTIDLSVADRAPLRLEGDHWAIPGCATLFCLGADAFGRMAHLVDLTYGHEGLLASTTEDLEPGTRISLGFEATGYAARRGEVIASRREGAGFRVAIRFEQRLAA